MVNENFMKCAMHGAEKVEPFESHRLSPMFMWMFMLLVFFCCIFLTLCITCHLSFIFLFHFVPSNYDFTSLLRHNELNYLCHRKRLLKIEELNE